MGTTAPLARRLVHHRHRVPGAVDLPGGRAVDLHRSCHRAGRGLSSHAQPRGSAVRRRVAPLWPRSRRRARPGQPSEHSQAPGLRRVFLLELTRAERASVDLERRTPAVGASQHAGVSFTAMVEAGVNLPPPAITISGIGVLAFGVRPRVTSAVVYALLAWSLLVLIVGSIGSTSHWILDTSVFHQMGSAPATSPHWAADGVMAAIGVAAALIGGIAFNRRDLQAE